MKGYDLKEVLEGLDPAALSYEEWVKVGMALKEEGYSAYEWDQWSKSDHARYKPGECYKKWSDFGKYSGEKISGGTLVHIAKAHGWHKEEENGGGVFGWEDTIRPLEAFQENYTLIKDPGWIEEAPLEAPRDVDEMDQAARYLRALFQPEEHVGYCCDAIEDAPGHFRPANRGVYYKTAGELLRDLEKYKSDPDGFGFVFGDYNPEAGVWIRFNPLDGEGVGNANVTTYRYALVESDDASIDRQYALIKELELPVAMLVHSGGKSLHAIVKIDAADEKEYRERVNFLYQVLEDNDFELDTQNKNPSRLSRLPGVRRGDHRQYIVAENIGQKDYAAWRTWIEEQTDDLPDPESLASVWDKLPPLAPALIDGVLRQGHKMLLAGPSKAGKSFALIQLCIALAEGDQWLGMPCAQGKVLYINLELDRASALHRFRDVYKALKIEPKHIQDIHIWNLRGMAAPLDKLAPKLIRRAKEQDYIAIVLDPIYKVITGDENSASDMAAFTNQFDLIASEVGCAVIYCHHHSKGYQGQKKSMDRASGSGVFARDPDALLDMTDLPPDQKTFERLRMLERTRLMDEAVKAKDPNYWKWMPDHSDRVALEEALQKLYTKEEQVGLAADIELELSTLEDMTAWRIEGTLREFPTPKPINLWFRYPCHIVDHYGVLEDLKPESEMTLWERGKASQKTAEEREESRSNQLEIAYTTLETEDPDEPITLQDLADQLQKSERTVKRWMKEHGGFEMEYTGPQTKARVVRRHGGKDE